jgi:hypothetical protein
MGGGGPFVRLAVPLLLVVLATVRRQILEAQETPELIGGPPTQGGSGTGTAWPFPTTINGHRTP